MNQEEEISEYNFYLNQNDEVVIEGNTSDSESDESEYYSEIESDNEYDEINRLDYMHFYSEKQHNHYYIGLCDKDYSPPDIIMSSSVSPEMYFKYSNKTMVRYLYYYSGIYNGLQPNKLSIDIMKLHIDSDGTYNIIIKTFWLRIIQRTWKKIYKQRLYVKKNRLQSANLKYREIHGNWPRKICYLPSLNGMCN